MKMAWSGFSEEELRRIQQTGHNESVSTSLSRGRRTAVTNRSRQQLQRHTALHITATHPAALNQTPLAPEQKLQHAPSTTTPPAPSTAASHSTSSAPSASTPPKQELQQAAEASSTEPVAAAVMELDKQEVELRDKARLQQLQWEQRMMEEKNKRTKALLAKTIAEKSKQTQAEAVKLKKIQKELQLLDDSVSSDIGVLRRLIDEASLEYSVAWKRLEKAEAEYVAAKLDLHKKTEVKEQLTEHLCAIIQQNELRKAQKLEELMLQLELSTEQVSRGELEQGSEERADPIHSPTVRETEVKSDGQIQTDCTDLTIESVAKTHEAQEREAIKGITGGEG